MDKQLEPNDGGSSRALAARHTEPNTGLAVINLLDEKQLAAAEIFLKKFMSSEKGGIKSVADGLSILARAQDLQLPLQRVLNIFTLLMVRLVLMFISLSRYYRGQE